jgi:hypothetical protein
LNNASATVMNHGVKEGGKLVKTIPVTITDLKKVKTPKETKYWHPVPHARVPELIIDAVKTNGWDFVGTNGDRFQMVMTENSSKLFGVCKIVIPGVETGSDFQMALGFRNSQDKTLSLRIAVGTNVIVCSNLLIRGEIMVKEYHGPNMDPINLINRAFDMIPGAAKSLSGWMGNMREIKITEDNGVAFLAEAVERKALSTFDFMEVRANFLSAYRDENPAIDYGNSLWSAVQACSESWKKHLLSSVQPSSEKLYQLVQDRYSIN